VVDALMREGSVAPSQLAEMLDLPADAGESTDAYAALLATFRARKLPGSEPPEAPGGPGAARLLRALA